MKRCSCPENTAPEDAPWGCLCYADGPKENIQETVIETTGPDGKIEERNAIIRITFESASCGIDGHVEACNSMITNPILVSPWINLAVLAPILYRIAFHLGTYRPQAELLVLGKRAGLHLVVVFARAGLYLLTAGLAYSDHVVLAMMVVTVVAIEAAAVHSEPFILIAQKVILSIYAIAVLILASTNTLYTAKFFHSHDEIITGLLVGSVFPLLYIGVTSSYPLFNQLQSKSSRASQ